MHKRLGVSNNPHFHKKRKHFYRGSSKGAAGDGEAIDSDINASEISIQPYQQKAKKTKAEGALLKIGACYDFERSVADDWNDQTMSSVENSYCFLKQLGQYMDNSAEGFLFPRTAGVSDDQTQYTTATSGSAIKNSSLSSSSNNNSRGFAAVSCESAREVPRSCGYLACKQFLTNRPESCSIPRKRYIGGGISNKNEFLMNNSLQVHKMSESTLIIHPKTAEPRRKRYSLLESYEQYSTDSYTSNNNHRSQASLSKILKEKALGLTRLEQVNTEESQDTIRSIPGQTGEAQRKTGNSQSRRPPSMKVPSFRVEHKSIEDSFQMSKERLVKKIDLNEDSIGFNRSIATPPKSQRVLIRSVDKRNSLAGSNSLSEEENLPNNNDSAYAVTGAMQTGQQLNAVKTTINTPTSLRLDPSKVAIAKESQHSRQNRSLVEDKDKENASMSNLFINKNMFHGKNKFRILLNHYMNQGVSGTQNGEHSFTKRGGSYMKQQQQQQQGDDKGRVPEISAHNNSCDVNTMKYSQNVSNVQLKGISNLRASKDPVMGLPQLKRHSEAMIEITNYKQSRSIQNGEDSTANSSTIGSSTFIRTPRKTASLGQTMRGSKK